MRIGLIGYGKMGRSIDALSKEFGFEVASKVSTHSPQLDTGVDLYLDFSSPEATTTYLPQLIENKIPVVIGTTGLEEHLDTLKTLTIEQKGSVLFSPNFSLGMALFIRILEECETLLAPYKELFHCYGIETHHSAKKDAPSGSAKKITEKLNIPFRSLRVGDHVGTHEVCYESPMESLSIKHTAHERSVFAKGALVAARWLNGKEGWYTLDDLLSPIHCAYHTVS